MQFNITSQNAEILSEYLWDTQSWTWYWMNTPIASNTSCYLPLYSVHISSIAQLIERWTVEVKQQSIGHWFKFGSKEICFSSSHNGLASFSSHFQIDHDYLCVYMLNSNYLLNKICQSTKTVLIKMDLRGFSLHER